MRNNYSLDIWYPWLIAAVMVALLTVSECNRLPAHAESYVEAFGGIPFGNQRDGVAGKPSVVIVRPIAPGQVIGVRAGAWKEYVGAEIEVLSTHATLKADKMCDWPTPVCQQVPGRHVSMQNIGFNGLLRYPHQTIEPFIGLGIAYIQAKLSADTCANGHSTCGPFSTPFADSTQRSDTIGYTYKIGALWKITEQWGLTTTYEGQVADLHFNGLLPGSLTGGAAETLSGNWQSLQAGVRRTF